MIYLHMELFGYEDLLYDLANSKVKIQLNALQKELFDRCKLGALFEFEGEPQIKVYALFREEKGFNVDDYKLYVDKL